MFDEEASQSFGQSFDFDRWDKHKSETRYGRLLLGVIYGSTTRRILPVVAALVIFSFIVDIYNVQASLADPRVPFVFPELQLPITPFELTAPVLGLLLVFRTDSAYERFNLGSDVAWEITSSCRSALRRMSSWTSQADAEAALDLMKATTMLHGWIMSSYLRAGARRGEVDVPVQNGGEQAVGWVMDFTGEDVDFTGEDVGEGAIVGAPSSWGTMAPSRQPLTSAVSSAAEELVVVDTFGSAQDSATRPAQDGGFGPAQDSAFGSAQDGAFGPAQAEELLRTALGVRSADEASGGEELSRLARQPRLTPYLAISAISLGMSQRLPSLTDQERIAVDDELDRITCSLAKCEKLLRTPIPLGYTRYSVRFLWVWLSLLPFALVRTFNDFGANTWWEDKPQPVLTVAMLFIGFVFLSIEDIAVQIEEPFAILPLETHQRWLLRDAEQVTSLMQWAKQYGFKIGRGGGGAPGR
ncbi:hypothetical protein Ctob_009805 [Chrysochromulina tobinii]|uniref:Uncharacterized protein n=1 Tax=Chrysochromulina tobinii TaxID=1460289 RepID=A0A0M0JAF0_9EUKA|nr:hypothetical protein Ctob_009805 [Chrysochromulina tobinii]|eukprot:KOO23569.1 hypothetical protein Ctob_009805 [Chrysochromulina sp. CCMP291]